jgi:hypothetical protein
MNLASFAFIVLLGALYGASAQAAEGFPQLLPPKPQLTGTLLEQHGSTIFWLLPPVLCVVGVILWSLLRRKPRALIPPEVAARRALDALREKPATGETVCMISQVLKRYCSHAFCGNAAELTTGEVRAMIDAQKAVAPELKQQLLVFLSQCDQVAFSRETDACIDDPVGEALRLVESLTLARIRQP